MSKWLATALVVLGLAVAGGIVYAVAVPNIDNPPVDNGGIPAPSIGETPSAGGCHGHDSP